jgi:hypothetical protein
MSREVDGALAKLTGAAVRAANELSSMRATARASPQPVRIQLNNATDELDLLRFRLHEATLMHVVAAADTPSG